MNWYTLLMSTATLVSVDEYLATSYRPDCDFVDGVVIERNLGTKDHSKLQGEIFAWFRDRRTGVTPLRISGTARSSSATTLPRPGRVRVPFAGARRADIYTAPLHLY